jgi:hypothetical protein
MSAGEPRSLLTNNFPEISIMSIINSGLLQKLVAFGFVATGALTFNAGQASAVCPPDFDAGGSETPLFDLVNNEECDFRVDAGADILDSGAETFSTDLFKALFYLEFEIAGDADYNDFGVYDVASGAMKSIFKGADDSIEEAGAVIPGENRVGRNTANLFTGFGSDFGFYLTNKHTNSTFYSESGKNGGVDMAKIFEGDGTSKFDLQQDGAKPYHKFHLGDLIIAFEDRAPGQAYADADYNDMVVYMHRKDVDVPEPATLLGLSLVSGAFGFLRKRDRN